MGSARPKPGSIGKLRISNEMKHKLELVTANHSLRSAGKPRPPAIPNLQSSQTGKLDSERRLLLQQQLGKFLKEILSYLFHSVLLLEYMLEAKIRTSKLKINE